MRVNEVVDSILTHHVAHGHPPLTPSHPAPKDELCGGTRGGEAAP